MADAHQTAAPTVVMYRDPAGVITGVDGTIRDLLGWAPSQLVGSPSTKFLHPQDQASAVTAWMEMITAPGTNRVWRGRYRAADGSWKWVETVNSNLLEDPDVRAVRTTMAPIAADQLSVEEELQAREHLLSQLSDALPVGLVQIDTGRRVTFTNARLHSILHCDDAATVEALFGDLAPDDAALLEKILAEVLADRPVDDVELTVRESPHQVVSMSFRTLTDPDARVTGAIGVVNDVTERVQMRHQLELRASVDELTACLNRRAVLELLHVTLDAAAADSQGTAVIFVDLDGFKSVNDRCGHATGDQLLIEVSQRLRGAVRSIDQIGRLGGDEFLVVCPHVGSRASALEIGDRVAAALHDDLHIDRHEVRLRASVGVAFTTDETDPDRLAARADHAMYEAKRSSRAGAVLAQGERAAR